MIYASFHNSLGVTMSLPHQTKLVDFISCRSEAVKLNHGPGSVKKSDTTISLYDNESKERIKKMLKKLDLSVSSYDTAWMAMAPSSVSPHQLTPQFSSCLNWVLNNQLSDGSWGLCDRDKTLTIDALSSTLACVLALKQWGTGENQINKGLEFVASNSAFLNDDKQRKPIGFDIIFPSMIEQAKALNLNVPVRQDDLNILFQRRNLEFASSAVDFPEGRRAYLAYVSEGVGIYQDWEMAMKYQRKNGSLLNSPSATAAAFSHLHNADCLHYLNQLLDRFGDAVPAAVYPLGISTRLCMVDNLEKLGIHHHFQEEIGAVLEETYRSWLQGDEEIFKDTTTCAMAFRILRLHIYDVSSDELRQFVDENHFRDTLERYLGETRPVLELFKASEIVIYQDEVILEEINSWTSCFLKDKQHAGEQCLDKHLSKEVSHALKFPYHADMTQLTSRRNIEHYKRNLDNTRMLKSAVRSCAIGNKDFLNLAVKHFNECLLIYQQDLKDVERWVVEKRLDKLKFARHRQVYCYFAAAAAIPNPELSVARVSWTKHALMVIYVDDFFDNKGSEEELENLVQLINKNGDVDINTDCSSREVEILYTALDSLIRESGDKALAWQGRCVKAHVSEIWLDVLKSMLREAEWRRKKLTPNMQEYVANGLISFAQGPIVLPTLYFLGPQLSEDATQSPQLQNLYELMSTCGRLLNDIQGIERESQKAEVNAVTLLRIHSGGGSVVVEQEEIIQTIKGLISSKRKELLRSTLEEDNDNNVFPRACKDLFWKLCVVHHFFFLEDDGFTKDNIMDDVTTFFQQII